MMLTPLTRTTLAVLVASMAACGTTPTEPTTPATIGAGSASTPSESPVPADTGDPMALRVLTHDSFNLSEELVDAFESASGISVEVVRGGDAGTVLNQAILTADNPLGDVIFGIDNVSLGKALEAGILADSSATLAAWPDIDPSTVLDPEGRAIPIDQGDVCLNYDREAYADGSAPADLAALRSPEVAGQLVVQDPSTSSPGLAFLLATVAAFGEDGWQDFWSDLREGGVTITSGWEDAYYGHFSGGAGEGDKPLVVSYASSPPAEVLFGPDPDAAVAPTGVITSTCFRQVEFAGVLEGAAHPQQAAAFLDFLLSDDVQSDIPLQMFVFPVRPVELPEVFVKHAATVDDPWTIDPATIEQNRERWVNEWVDLMLR